MMILLDGFCKCLIRPIFLTNALSFFTSYFGPFLLCRNHVLRMTKGIHELGTVQWPLIVCLAVSWLTCFLCLFKGIKSMGKVSSYMPAWKMYASYNEYWYCFTIMIKSAPLNFQYLLHSRLWYSQLSSPTWSSLFYSSAVSPCQEHLMELFIISSPISHVWPVYKFGARRLPRPLPLSPLEEEVGLPCLVTTSFITRSLGEFISLYAWLFCERPYGRSDVFLLLFVI